MEEIYAVCGLGNPGLKYKGTRHNVGFDTVDYMAAVTGTKIKKVKHKAVIGECLLRDSMKKVIFVKPQTFMNLSGESIAEIVDWYDIDLKNLIVIYDDVDLPLGKMRIRAGGSSGSHNGMKNIIYMLEENRFPRVRIGVDRQPENMDLASYVLSKFDKSERKIVNGTIEKAKDAVLEIIKSGVERAMNRFNERS